MSNQEEKVTVINRLYTKEQLYKAYGFGKWSQYFGSKPEDAEALKDHTGYKNFDEFVEELENHTATLQELKERVMSDEFNQRLTATAKDEPMPNDGSVIGGMLQEEILTLIEDMQNE